MATDVLTSTPSQGNPMPLSGAASVWLDGLRFLSGLAVVAGHVRTSFLRNYADLPAATLWQKAVYFATSWGHEAVLVFFVLSGFLIGLSVCQAHQRHKWSWPQFLSRRLTRLYVVLIPALIAAAFWDRLGAGLFGMAGNYYGGETRSAGVESIQLVQNGTLAVWFGNALFLQNIVVPSFGTNTALWSLSYEFWYYIVFACIGCAVWSHGFTTRLGGMVTALGLMLVLGNLGRMYLLIWLMGAGVAVLRTFFSQRIDGRLVPLAITVWLGGMFVAHGSILPVRLAEGVAGGVTAALIFTLTSSELPKVAFLGSRLASAGAAFTYTLYLVHLPMVYFLQSWLVPGLRWLPTPGATLKVAAILVAVIFYSWLFAQITEAKTDRLRGLVLGRLGPGQPSR